MPDDQDNAVDKPLKAWSRWLIGLVGLAIETTGLVATFVSGTNVAGVPLLIVAGAAFLYVALSGQQLIQVNKDGVTFGRARRLERTLNDVASDPEIDVETKARIVEAAEDNGIRLNPVPAMELESSVRALFEELGAKYDFQVQSVEPRAGADFILLGRAGRTIAVEVKGALRTREFAAAIRRIREAKFEEKLLIIVGGVPTEIAGAFRQERIWIMSSDREEVIATLRQMEFLGSS